MSYMGTHNRVRRIRGSARNYPCSACDEQAQEWAYNNSSPNEEIDSHGRRYSRDANDYDPMCYRCHRLRDKAAITHCPRGHAYEGDNLIIDAGKRKCRTCVYARNRGRKLTPEQRARATELQRERRRQQREAAA